MRLMNPILRSHIGKSVVVYFDDILVYSKSLEEHVTHVKEVLQILRHEKLYANLPKCTFARDKLISLVLLCLLMALKLMSQKSRTYEIGPSLQMLVNFVVFMGWPASTIAL